LKDSQPSSFEVEKGRREIHFKISLGESLIGANLLLDRKKKEWGLSLNVIGL